MDTKEIKELEIKQTEKMFDKFTEGFRDIPLTPEAAHCAGVFQLSRNLSLQQAARSGFKFPFWPDLGLPAHIKRGRDEQTP